MRFSVFVFVFIISASLAAQEYEENGYIVTLDNDTIPGFIKPGTDAELSTEISFKRGRNGIIKKYNPRELLGFGFGNGRTYERKKILTTSGHGVDSTFFFTKNLVRGKIDLFVLRFPYRKKPAIILTNNNTDSSVLLSKPVKQEVIGEDGKKYNRRDFEYVRDLAKIKGESSEVNYEDPVKFSEKKIKKDILKYNKKFDEEYPVSTYSEEVDYNYTILAGTSIASSEGLRYRIGFYRNKNSIERTTNFSFMQGIVYHYWSDDNQEIPQQENTAINYKWQFLNIIPIAIQFQGNSKDIQPYGYAGVGFGTAFLTDRIIENGEYTGDDAYVKFLPSLNAGIGLRIRMREIFLVTELTPTFNGFFVNLGLSI